MDDDEPLLDNNKLLAFLSTSPKPSPPGILFPEAILSPPRLNFSATTPPPSKNLAFLIPLPTLLVTSDPLSYLNSPRTPLRGLNNGLNSRVLTLELSECRVIPQSLLFFIITTEDIIEKGIMSGYEILWEEP